MADGLGSVSYNYDQLSRLSSETRYFSALSRSPTVGNYVISYQYNLANELTSVTDPFGAQMSYNRDTAGRVTSVTGSGFLNISSTLQKFNIALGAVRRALPTMMGTPPPPVMMRESSPPRINCLDSTSSSSITLTDACRR
jgi:YD repeat-containing protein